MRSLIIVGAGGQGRVAFDIAKQLVKYDRISFLDDNESVAKNNASVVGKTKDYAVFLNNSDFFVAVGDNCIRRRLLENLILAGASVVSLVHPSAIISEDVIIEQGSVIMAGAVINTGSRIGRGVIVNTCSSIDHDCIVGDYSHVSVGAHLAGAITIGQRTTVGIGAVVINSLTICDDVMIGAGAVVVKDLEIPGVYVGVPARIKQ